MTRFRMRLVERLIEEDSGDFTVEAPAPALAAGILLRAHDAARDECEDLVVLPDGHSCRIEPTDVVANQVFCILLDEIGQEIGSESEPDYPPPAVDADRCEDSSQNECARVQADNGEPGP